MSNDLFNNKTCLIVSVWGWPFGGGEEFLLTTMKWCAQLNIQCYWLAFRDGRSNSDYQQFEIVPLYQGYMFKIPGGLTQDKLLSWVHILKPDFIHHQGSQRRMIFDYLKDTRIPFISGFHFWTGAIIMDPVQKNIDMLEHAHLHQPDPELLYLKDQAGCLLYTVTPFVSQVIEKVTGVYIADHIAAASDQEKCTVPNIDPINNPFVAMINIHHLKGGHILLHLLKTCPDIHFLAVETEPGSDELTEQLKQVGGPRLKIIPRVKDIKEVFRQCKVLLVPSMVDETYCRVVNEAHMNRIPVVTTGAGNIKYLVGDGGIICGQDLQKWTQAVQKLWQDPVYYQQISQLAWRNYRQNSESQAYRQFQTVCKKVLQAPDNPAHRIMIFSPWCDQGLGIQSRNYAHTLLPYKQVFIFAIKPYNGSTQEMQKSPQEWVLYPDKDPDDWIYYSPNDREHVTNQEIIQFINKYRIGLCLLPETCWFRVFEVAKLLRDRHVKCVAIPNIEIVRRDELAKHQYFWKIACNNYLCQRIFRRYGYPDNKLPYLGYGIKKAVEFRPRSWPSQDQTLQFLFVGGMNAFSRKQILKVCQAFHLAYQKRPAQGPDFHLTCTIQKTNLLEVSLQQEIEPYLDLPEITFIQDHLPYQKIIDLMYSAHAFFQVSKHEGLGLGFYEALNLGTPVITLDCPPHNEIIQDNINGWVVDCYPIPMVDNKDPIFDSHTFDPQLLADTILHIVSHPEQYKQLVANMSQDIKTRLSFARYEQRLLDIINVSLYG